MRRAGLIGVGVLGLALAGAVAEHEVNAAGLSTAFTHAVPDRVALQPSPIRPDWVLEGSPRTEAAEIARTNDGSTKVFVWQTTAGRFNWQFSVDEIVTVLDGEVFVTDADGSVRRLGPGDVAHFPVGATTTWHVPDHVRKIAVVKRPFPAPFASVMRWARAAKDWIKPNSSAAL